MFDTSIGMFSLNTLIYTTYFAQKFQNMKIAAIYNMTI